MVDPPETNDRRTSRPTTRPAMPRVGCGGQRGFLSRNGSLHMGYARLQGRLVDLHTYVHVLVLKETPTTGFVLFGRHERYCTRAYYGDWTDTRNEGFACEAIGGPVSLFHSGLRLLKAFFRQQQSIQLRLSCTREATQWDAVLRGSHHSGRHHWVCLFVCLCVWYDVNVYAKSIQVGQPRQVLESVQPNGELHELRERRCVSLLAESGAAHSSRRLPRQHYTLGQDLI